MTQLNMFDDQKAQADFNRVDTLEAQRARIAQYIQENPSARPATIASATNAPLTTVYAYLRSVR